MLSWLLEHNVLVSIENPSSSTLWQVPEFVAWHDLQRLTSVSVDYCQFSQPWRKRTRFAFSSVLNASSLQRLCKGHKGVCSRTGKLHVQLKGKLREVNLTKLAEPYPKVLCHRIATLVSTQYQFSILRKLDRLCK